MVLDRDLRRPRWKAGMWRTTMSAGEDVPASRTVAREAPGATTAVPTSGQRSLRSLNVRWPFASLLRVGLKTVELRTYPLASRFHTGEWLWLVETRGTRRNLEASAFDRDLDPALVMHIKEDPRATRAIAMIRFGEVGTYDNLDSFRRDRARHLVAPGSRFEWDGKRSLYYWKVRDVIPLQHDVPVVNVFPRDIVGFRVPRSLPEAVVAKKWALVRCFEPEARKVRGHKIKMKPWLQRDLCFHTFKEVDTSWLKNKVKFEHFGVPALAKTSRARLSF